MSLDKEELKEYLKNNLKVNVSCKWGEFDCRYLKVELELDGAVISSDSLNIRELEKDGGW